MKDLMQVNVEAVLTAILLSKTNGMLVSEPGWGKTKMAYFAAKQICSGENEVPFIPLSPSAPPEVIEGPVDVTALKEGRFERNKSGTPYDPNAKIVILDELFRSNEVVFDLLLHATNDVTRTDAPVFLGTSNWIVKSQRTEALVDRFAVWYYFEPLSISPVDVLEAGDVRTWTFDVPDFKTIEDVRAVPMTDDNRKAVIDAIDLLIDTIGNEGFKVNPRRVEAWGNLLFRSAVHSTGGNGFSSLPDEAFRVLKYAYPATDADTYRQWQTVAGCMTDAAGVALEEVMAIVMKKIKDVQDANGTHQKTVMMSELGQVLAESLDELEKFKGDPRVADAEKKFRRWFKQAAAGKVIK
ncbi:MAG: AAA family ATPase [bacterium]